MHVCAFLVPYTPLISLFMYAYHLSIYLLIYLLRHTVSLICVDKMSNGFAIFFVNDNMNIFRLLLLVTMNHQK